MFRDNAKINNNNNNYFTSIYYFILLLLVFFGCSSVMVMANQPIISPSSCYFLDQNTNTLYIGKTAPNQKPQTIRSTVSIFSSGLPKNTIINKIILEGSVSTKGNAAVIIKNTHNMKINNGIEIAPGCTIESEAIAIDIPVGEGELTTDIINYGTIKSVYSYGFHNFSHIDGEFKNYGTVKGKAYAFHDNDKLTHGTKIHNYFGATIKGKMAGTISMIKNSGNITDTNIDISQVNLTIENERSGTISIKNITYMNNTTHIDLTNHGKITAAGIIKLHGNLINSGTIIQTGLTSDFTLKDNSNKTYTATNTGYIRARNFSIHIKLINQASGNMQLNKGLSFHNEVENHGIINVTGNDWIHFDDKVTNSGVLTTPYGFGFEHDLNNDTTGKISLGYSSNHTSEHYINGNVNNRGSLYFSSHVDKVSITNYHGYNTSELVLTLPSSKPTSLLTVTNNATFDAGAKIILAATTSLSYLSSKTPICILTAKNRLTVAGSVEDLLYSRVYDENNNIVTAGGLSSNSILINITNATATQTTITADLQMANLSSLNILHSDLKIMTSLLNNDIAYSLPKTLKTTTQSIITTASPTSYYDHYTNNRIAIGLKNGKAAAIYATANDPAVLIISSGLSPAPTISKITFKGNVYGVLTTALKTFSHTAVEITNTNNMQIKDGIEVDHGCTIKGKIAIDIQGELTTTIINRGTISGTDIAINNFRYITGKFENYGIIHGDNYSFNDNKQSTGTNYKIYNHIDAIIEGTICTSAQRIVNSGVIKDAILQSYATLTIENMRFGKILSTEIKRDNNAHITLVNAGEITVTGNINIDRNFTNSGTLIQSTSGSLSLGTSKNNAYQIINSGYIKAEGYESHHKLTNQATGYIHLEGDQYYNFHNTVVNAGTMSFIGTDGKNDWMSFIEGGTNSGYITLNKRGFQSHKNFFNSGTIEQTNGDFNLGDSKDTNPGNDIVTNRGCIQIQAGTFTAYNKIENQLTGIITISRQQSGNFLHLQNEVSNSGTINAWCAGSSKGDSLDSGFTFYNSGTVSVKHACTSFYGDMTNTGTIIAQGKNSSNIGLKFEKMAYNSGYIETTYITEITPSQHITNRGHFITSGLQVDQGSSAGNAYFDNQATTAVTEFTTTFNDQHINIENQGSLALQGSSTIGDYHGKNTSELVLTLPSSKTASLLTVTNNATFDAGAKIILAATTSLPYLQNSTTINILTAKKLTVAGSVEDLLYSRVYGANNSILKAANPLVSSSILIDITTATADATHITANLQMVSLSKLNTSTTYLKTINSLLNNKITQRTTEIITTADPIKNYNNTHNNIYIGKTSSGNTPQAIYAQLTNPAVLIAATSYPTSTTAITINKINFTADVYGKSRGNKTFNNTAVEINNTNNMQIKYGIEVNSGCTIKGNRAIEIKDKLTTNFINNGTISGIDYSFYDSTSSAQSYEIHNQAGATIEGEIYTNALRIENSGTINGEISIQYSDITIENMRSGKIQATAINKHSNSNAHITLVNAGEITVTGDINIDRNFTNSGTLIQSTSRSLSLGTSKNNAYQIINSGYIRAHAYESYYKLTNKATGYIHLEGSQYYNFHDTVVNAGTMSFIGTDGKNDWMSFIEGGTNSGYITLNSRGFRSHKTFFNSGTIEQTNGDFNLGDSNDTNPGNDIVTNTGYIRSGNLIVYNILTNYGRVVAGISSSELDIKDNAKINNFGYMEVIGGLTSRINSSFTNSGTALIVFTLAGADFNGPVNNSATIKTKNTYLTTYTKKFTNSGTVDIDGVATIGSGGLENSGSFSAKSLASSGSGLFNNLTTNSKLACTDPISAKSMPIDNQGSVALQGANTIGNYHGYKNSELVLTLPSTQPTSLLTVTNNASFDAGAKIILAADKQLTYLSTPTSIDIVTAKNLIVGGSVDELLYSRVYNTNNNIVTAGALSSNSILINITNATATQTTISAKLQMADLSSLHLIPNDLKATRSLLKYDICYRLKVLQTNPPSVITTASPIEYYDYYTSNAIDIAIKKGKTATIYATATAPAVLIVNSNLFSAATITKITFRGNVYGALTTTRKTFSHTAVEITNTNKIKNMNVKYGIEVDHGCTIKGKIALDIQDGLTGTIINHGTISATDIAIKDFWRITGSFENHGIVKGHNYSFYDKPSPTANYEIHNQTGAIIEGTISTSAHKIVNSGTITGVITINNSKTIIDNKRLGRMDVSINLTNSSTITNSGKFIADKLQIDQGKSAVYSYFNNQTQNAIAEFTAVINEPHINIENQGSLLLQGSSTIGAYDGNNTSELVLNLPTKAPQQGNSLLRVINDATFTQGAKIILAASSSVTYLTKKSATKINILTAKNLTIAGSVEELLYSRAYDTNKNIVTAGGLSIHSILINITNATATQTTITADLQMADLSSLNLLHSDLKIMTSLLNNDIAYSLPKILKKTTKSIITTASPTSYYDHYTNNRIAIGLKNGKAAAIYATANDPAVLIISSGLSPAPTISKITFKGNVYGVLTTALKTFSHTAVEITNTNNMQIKDGIEVDHGCTIKGKIAIDIQGELTTTIINRGTISGTDIAINNFRYITGKFENYGIIHGDNYSFNDNKQSTGTNYEIHNYAGAIIEGEIETTAQRIVNNGTIKGKISINYSNATIENKRTGKIQSSEIDWHNSANITLINAGEITVTGIINIDRNFINNGTIIQGDLSKKFNLGDSSNKTYTATNTGYIRAGYFVTSSKLINQASGNIQMDTGLRFENEVENHGIMNVTGNDWLQFLKKVTNTGILASPYGFEFADGLDNSTTGKIALGYSSNYTSKHYINGNVNNRGSLYFSSHVDKVTITNYHGYNTSELVLTLPSSKPTSLLTVTNNATFDAGAKIILAATTSLSYLKSKQNICILTANSGLTVAGSVEDLLYSRAYDANHKIIKTGGLSSNSILIHITNAIATATDIKADLQLTSIGALQMDSTKATLVNSLLKNKVISAANKKKALKIVVTTKPTVASIISKTDASGIEFYKSVDNHFTLTNDIFTSYNTKVKQKQAVKNKFNIADANYNINATIATSSGKDKQHKWSETLLSVGGDSELNTITFGFTFAYLANKLSTTNLYKSDLHSYHGIAYIVYNLNDIRLFSYKLNDIRLFASGIYSATSHKNESVTGKNANEFSLAVAASHRFIVKDFNIDVGINSQLMGVGLSQHSYQKTYKVAKNNKSFLSLGCFIEAAKSKQLYNGAKVSASLTSSYTYIAGIANTDKIMVLDANNNSILIPQDKPNSHRFYNTLKAQVDYNNWFSSLSLNYSKKAHQNIYGGNLAAGYRF